VWRGGENLPDEGDAFTLSVGIIDILVAKMEDGGCPKKTIGYQGKGFAANGPPGRIIFGRKLS